MLVMIKLFAAFSLPRQIPYLICFLLAPFLRNCGYWICRFHFW